MSCFLSLLKERCNILVIGLASKSGCSEGKTILKKAKKHKKCRNVLVNNFISMLFENCFCNLLRGRFFCLWWCVVERGRDNNSATNHQSSSVVLVLTLLTNVDTIPFTKFSAWPLKSFCLSSPFSLYIYMVPAMALPLPLPK